jgi:hypothetical protein
LLLALRSLESGWQQHVQRCVSVDGLYQKVLVPVRAGDGVWMQGSVVRALPGEMATAADGLEHEEKSFLP